MDEPEEPRVDKVVLWRTEELVRAGFSELNASVLAFRRDVDLHRAITLVRRGCDPQTAFEILA